MSLKDKIMEGLRCCSTDRVSQFDCEKMECPYLDMKGAGCIHQLIGDAYNLIKSEERYIEDLEQDVPFAAMHTSIKMAQELEALLWTNKPRVITMAEIHTIGQVWNYNTPPYLWFETKPDIK